MLLGTSGYFLWRVDGGSTTWWAYALLYMVRNDNKASALTSQVRESVIIHHDGYGVGESTNAVNGVTWLPLSVTKPWV
jgi:hypothetical protein